MERAEHEETSPEVPEQEAERKRLFEEEFDAVFVEHAEILRGLAEL
jgi:hypothetical protein